MIGFLVPQTFVSINAIWAAIRQLHATVRAQPVRQRTYWAINATGGAAEIASALLAIGGASGMFFLSENPYHPAASWAYTGRQHHDDIPAVCEEAALRLSTGIGKIARDRLQSYAAVPSHQRDKRTGEVLLDPKDPPKIIALGATSATQTRDKRGGGDRTHFAVTYANGEAYTVEVWFDRDGWEGKHGTENDDVMRGLQNLLLTVFGLNLILEAMGCPQIPMSYKGLPGKIYCRQMIFAPDGDTFTLEPRRHLAPLEELTEESLAAAPVFYASGTRDRSLSGTRGMTLIPSSLNTLTAAHRHMETVMEAAAPLRRLLHVLNRTHPDKQATPLPLDQTQARLQACRGHVSVIVRNGGAYYADMAEEYPDAWIAIGEDVFRKLVDPNNPRRDADLARMQRAGATLIVFGRDGAHMDRERIPNGFEPLFRDVRDLFADHPDPAWRKGFTGETPVMSSTLQGLTMGDRKPKA